MKLATVKHVLRSAKIKVTVWKSQGTEACCNIQDVYAICMPIFQVATPADIQRKIKGYSKV